MIDIIHKGCGMVAFRYDHRPGSGELFKAEHATLLDGTKPQSGGPMTCGTCGNWIENVELVSVDAQG
jgi:hypothetical protein